jgi:hypothetical protein
VSRFEREAQLPATLNHTGIATGIRRSFPMAVISCSWCTAVCSRRAPGNLGHRYRERHAPNESGATEIYVAPFPGPGQRVMMSRGGGAQPRWSPDGKELF